MFCACLEGCKTVIKCLISLRISRSLPELQEQNWTNIRVIHVIARLFPHPGVLTGVPENPSTVLSLVTSVARAEALPQLPCTLCHFKSHVGSRAKHCPLYPAAWGVVRSGSDYFLSLWLRISPSFVSSPVLGLQLSVIGWEFNLQGFTEVRPVHCLPWRGLGPRGPCS